jgi:NAD(P)-dependent dehydrogenase (short-subunit alcohol dehydrogenase family)
MTDRAALVAGASRGLGLGLAAELQRRGWDVVATARDDAGKARLEGLVRKRGGGSLAVEHLDVTDAENIAALRRRCEGRLFDLVFVVAGIMWPPHQDAAQASPEEVAQLFLTNAIGPIRLARAFLDLVREETGVVGLMTSRLGSVEKNTDGHSELYRASKAALNSLTRSLAAKLDGRRITVLAVAPGWVRTDIGGPRARTSVEESVRGMLDVLEARRGSLRHGFVNYRGRELPW